MSAPAPAERIDDFSWANESRVKYADSDVQPHAREAMKAIGEPAGSPSAVASASPLAKIENTFLGRARYAKGRQTLQAILDATYALIISEGPTAASQQAIAVRAKVSQSAVRHYFPTKDDLLMAFFSTGIERLQALMMYKLAETARNPRTQLLECAELQFSRICEVDAVFFFEASVFARRNPGFAAMRDAWYQSVSLRYQQLIQEMHPDWSASCCEEAGFQVLTMILGGWVTAGHSRPVHKAQSTKALTNILQRGIERLIDG